MQCLFHFCGSKTIDGYIFFIGDQGKKWLLGEIEVPANFGAFHIVFEGVVGSDYHGDIAIDDIHMKQGGCYSGKSGINTYTYVKPRIILNNTSP